jgi:hypothetical protein
MEGAIMIATGKPRLQRAAPRGQNEWQSILVIELTTLTKFT